MTESSQTFRVQLSKSRYLDFSGNRLASVVALNHDNSVRRQFALYRYDGGFVAERIDDPGTIDVRFWGAKCDDADAVYNFFGNEPLANYLYGNLKLDVPGLRVISPVNEACDGVETL